jgi:hypothetical protein
MGATVVEEEVDGEVEVVDEEDLLPGFLAPLGGMMKACCPRLLALLCCLSLSNCVWCIVLERNDMQHGRRSNGECVMSGLTIIILTFHSGCSTPTQATGRFRQHEKKEDPDLVLVATPFACCLLLTCHWPASFASRSSSLGYYTLPCLHVLIPTLYYTPTNAHRDHPR